MLRRWLLAITTVLVALSLVGVDTATAASVVPANSHAYDSVSISPVEVDVAQSEHRPFPERSVPSIGRVERSSPARCPSTTTLAALNATEAAGGLGDDVVLVRGGTTTPDRFAGGSGVTSDGTGSWKACR
jgi:hypothetical protein